MRSVLSTLAAVALFGAPLSAQTADSIIARYLRTVGGMDRIQAVHTMRRLGKVTGGGGFEAAVVQENKRPNQVREEFSLMGMTQVTAYDGQNGWKIVPWQGKKDAEPLSEDELRGMVEDADFDEPLVNYQQKGNKVEYLGTDQFEGTDVYKLKVTYPNGDTRTYFLDTDYCVPIKIESRRTIRGEEQSFEMVLGNYKAVAGWYMPFSIESRALGGSNGGKVTIDSVQVNVPIDDSRFQRPGGAGTAAPQQQGAPKPAGRNGR
jgi:hypothetical protein